MQIANSYSKKARIVNPSLLAHALEHPEGRNCKGTQLFQIGIFIFSCFSFLFDIG